MDFVDLLGFWWFWLVLLGLVELAFVWLLNKPEINDFLDGDSVLERTVFLKVLSVGLVFVMCLVFGMVWSLVKRIWDLVDWKVALVCLGLLAAFVCWFGVNALVVRYKKGLEEDEEE